jgi:hypothetical protein
MVMFLSAPWFDRLRSHPETTGAPAAGSAETGPALVLRHRIRSAAGHHTGSPTGRDSAGGAAGSEAADYDVVIAGGRAMIRHPVLGPADLTFTSDYPTAAAIAAGTLSTRAALAEGRLRVAGDVGILSRRASDVAGLDPVPAALRADTEF